ncbi:MAG: rod shape-determining protein MreC [Kordiimonas sp.]|nr:rod shape-determining protein MreC [Kordiimonas sp.]
MKLPKGKTFGAHKHPFKVGRKVTAFLFIVLALFLLLIGKSQFSVVESARARLGDFFAPILNILSQPVVAVNTALQWGEDLSVAFNQNITLREENQKLRAEVAEASQYRIDNQRLKQLLKVHESDHRLVATSSVVADSGGSFVRSVLIAAGRNKGVEKGHAVINEMGVVGHVINVGRTSARVLLLTDLNSHIPVKLASTGENVILAGDNSSRPKLLYLPLERRVVAGEKVITSGQGGVFPPNLQVGEVEEIDAEGHIYVKLNARLYGLNYVSVVSYDSALLPEQNQSSQEVGSPKRPDVVAGD